MVMPLVGMTGMFSIASPGCKTPVTAVSDKSKTFQEDEKTVYFSSGVTKKLSMALIGRHN